jgi:26S proteasome regulatory subunit N13
MSNTLAGGRGGSDAATAAVNNLLASLNARQEQGQAFGGSAGAGRGSQEADMPYPFLTHLLPSSMTVPMIEAASEDGVENLLNFLPPSIIVLASSPGSGENKSEPTADELAAAKASLSLNDKRLLLKKVLRSPQFHQALASLTMALRDGGLPGIADALGVKVDNGGYIQGGGMPLGGGQAVKAFVDGIKKNVQEKKPEGS